MNLIDEKWIPIMKCDGKHDVVSLNYLFENLENIYDLNVNPVQKISLIRFFICITHSAFDGPKTDDELDCIKSQIKPCVLSYLNEWKDRFNLYDDKYPFLQISGLTSSKEIRLDKLDLTLASGSNCAFFDTQIKNRNYEKSWIALSLLTFQNFSLAGLQSTVTWNEEKTNRYGKWGCTLHNNPLWCFIQGNNLLETICYNLISKERLHKHTNMGWGKAVWEKYPQSIDDVHNEEFSGYLGTLVPLSRFVLLNKNNTMIYGSGLEHKRFPIVRDPMYCVKKGKKENKILRYSIDKHPWRELCSLLTLTLNDKVFPPCTFVNLNKITDIITIWTGGAITVDPKMTAIKDMNEWTFSFHPSILENVKMENFKKGIEIAEKGYYKLYNAVSQYYKMLFPKNNFKYDIIEYWSYLNSKYELLIKIVENDEGLGEWTNLIINKIEKMYNRKCSTTTLKKANAYFKAKLSLMSFFKQIK